MMREFSGCAPTAFVRKLVALGKRTSHMKHKKDHVHPKRTYLESFYKGSPSARKLELESAVAPKMSRPPSVT